MVKAKSSKRKTATGGVKPGTVKPRTYVTLLLDRSGSMSSIKGPTIEGFNTFVSGLQAEKNADIVFTFLQFDTESVDKCIVAKPISGVPFLTDETFLPRGGTPLIDAAYKTIKAVEEAVSREESKPKVVVCIQTDGEENASREHTWDQLAALVKAKQETGWQFNFLGAGIDAYRQAARIGIMRAATVSYGVGLGETRAAFAASASTTSNFSSGVAENTFYTAQQKQASGDKYDTDVKATKAAKSGSPK